MAVARLPVSHAAHRIELCPGAGSVATASLMLRKQRGTAASTCCRISACSHSAQARTLGSRRLMQQQPICCAPLHGRAASPETCMWRGWPPQRWVALMSEFSSAGAAAAAQGTVSLAACPNLGLACCKLPQSARDLHVGCRPSSRQGWHSSSVYGQHKGVTWKSHSSSAPWTGPHLQPPARGHLAQAGMGAERLPGPHGAPARRSASLVMDAHFHP